MKMIDLGRQRGPLHMNMNMNMNINYSPISVDCGREVRLRRSFRSLMECVVPACCGFQPSSSSNSDLSSDPESSRAASTHTTSTTSAHASSSSTRVTGTLFGNRKGRVSLCIQEDSRSSSPPLLLLEFAVPTAFLAREMQQGQLRIALVECRYPPQKSSSTTISTSEQAYFSSNNWNSSSSSSSSSTYRSRSALLKVPVWCMYCNGRKVGFAIRREMRVGDVALLKLMQSVSVGAGVLPISPKSDCRHDDDDLMMIMYLRANFQRVIGSTDSESFHMINPLGSSAHQDLSIFLLRS
ncbi:Protein MIZU-KUSSEI like [Actinidia chinensis var. chinensis]|uniref:Protein MIZU-KUSSEI like n=1 Tax=Actinidia chinensis var. chinensis TaxID=1590841 RepID=A0A2R6RM81_ACTCC|nr:Protein MIZU-KUSSEI like [Actinidia chinensis var. chinensis]